MTIPHQTRFVQLATVGNLTTAHLLAARLEAEGIEVRVHGESKGPYPMIVGEFADAELWVLQDRVDEAKTILLDAEVNDALAPAEPDFAAGVDRATTSFETKVVAGVVLAIILVLVVLRFAAIASRL